LPRGSLGCGNYQESLGAGGLGGIAVGYSALCRPQALMVVPFLLLLALGRGRGGRLAAAAALLAGLAIAIAPWTIRNYVVQGQRFVLIATNGGAVFYAANSMEGDPLRGGRYHEEAYARLAAWCPDEVKRDKLGYQLGKQEIRADWLCFLRSLLYRYDTMWGVHLQPLAYTQMADSTRKLMSTLLLMSYWFIPALYLVNWRRGLALFRASPVAQVLGAVYVTYMVVLIPFEVSERSHYPALLIPLILAVGSLLRAEPCYEAVGDSDNRSGQQRGEAGAGRPCAS
jgi:hypothetical protein